MATVRFTDHLRSQTGGVIETHASGTDVKAVIADLERRMPGLRHYLVDDQGALRTHVNVFLDGDPIRDRQRLSDPVGEHTVVHVLQALSGG